MKERFFVEEALKGGQRNTFLVETHPRLKCTMNALTLSVKDGQYVAKGSADAKPLSNCRPGC